MIVITLILLILGTGCDAAGDSDTLDDAAVESRVDTRVAEALTSQITQTSSLDSHATATTAPHPLFADLRFGISFVIPQGFEIESDESEFGPPATRKVWLSGQHSRIFIFLQDDGPPPTPTPVPPPTPLPSPTPTMIVSDCESFRPGPPESYESEDAYDEAVFEYDACQDYLLNYQIEQFEEDYDEESRYIPDQGEDENSSTPAINRIRTKYNVLIEGFSALIEHLADEDGNFKDGLEYKLSAQFPDGFKIQISYFGDDQYADELDYTATSIRLARPSLTMTSAPDAITATETALRAVEPAPTTPDTPVDLVPATLERVIDGDTIVVIVNGEAVRVRYIGIDTPETVDPNRDVQCFGPEASAKNAELLNGQRIWLERDVSETDRYGRALRYVWIGQPDSLVMVNEDLVRSGYAVTSTYPPDVKYQDRFLAAERDARASGAGLWSACPT